MPKKKKSILDQSERKGLFVIQEENEEDIDSEVNEYIRRGLGKLVPIEEPEPVVVHPRKEIYLDDIVSFKLGLLRADEIRNSSSKIASDIIIQSVDQSEDNEGKVILLDDIVKPISCPDLKMLEKLDSQIMSRRHASRRSSLHDVVV